MEMMKFIKNRKREHRNSLIIDTLTIDSELDLKRRSSYSDSILANSVGIPSETGSYESYPCMTSSKPTYESTCNPPIHICNLCANENNVQDSFMILTCGHIFHIRCLVDNHYSEANKFGVIDEQYFKSRKCLVCTTQMETEDILYIHNKFYKSTKDYITKQEEHIEKLDKQMTKLKDELRSCYEYKQGLEQKRDKSKQIAVIINTMM